MCKSLKEKQLPGYWILKFKSEYSHWVKLSRDRTDRVVSGMLQVAG